LKRNLTSW